MRARSLTIASGLLLALGCAACGGSGSGHTPTPIPPTGFQVTSLMPSSAPAGSPDLSLTVTGTDFNASPGLSGVAVWSANGTDTFLTIQQSSNSQIIALVPAAFLKNAITASIYVASVDEGFVVHAKTNPVDFVVNAPFPVAVISSVSPSSISAGGPSFTLTVTGTNFSKVKKFVDEGQYVLYFGNRQLATNNVNDTQLIATVPAEAIATPATVSITAETPDFFSNSVDFKILASNTITILPPSDSLGPRGERQFGATLSGNQTPVTWTVREGSAGGEITPTGLYTAPSAAGTYHVVATALSDSTELAAATVTVLTSGFSPTGSMSSARSGHTATLLTNGKVLVAGPDATAELYDPATGTFSPTATMFTSRYGATATPLADGNVLIAGGYGTGSSQLPRLSSAELYDPKTGKFSPTGSMSVGRIRHTATLLADGRVLIVGGVDGDGGGGAASQSAELYDPAAGTFTPTGEMASERAGHTATLLASGQVLVVGGWNGHAADSDDDPPWDPFFVELFAPTSGAFKSSGSMSTTRINANAIRFSDGNVLLLGGVPDLQNEPEQPVDPLYAELYDPTSGTFSSEGNLALNGTENSATLILDGTVLIAGGKQGGITVPWAVLVDPVTRSLSATGGLVTARSGHTATRLTDGRVLVTGGTDSNGSALASAELYK